MRPHEYSKQFPVKPKLSRASAEGELWYYPFAGHSGQRLMHGPWWKLEVERKKLSRMGYKYENFKKRNL